MPCVSLDTSFPDSDQAIRLALRLQERLAWCFVVRLWCWGMDQNREDGVLRLDSKRIAEVCSWRGDPDEFVAALVEVELLVKQDGDDTYYMAGWSRNKEFFAKKNRMRDYRERKKAARRAARESSRESSRETPQETSRETSHVTSPETSQETPSRSLSRSRSLDLLERDRARADDDVSGAAEKLHQAFGRLLSSKDQARLTDLKPTPEEIETAIAQTKEQAGKPNAGYALSIVESSRRKPPPRERQHNPRVGYHPGSKPEEFGEGDQVL